MLISLLLAAAIILLMFAGCGNTSNEIASTPAESESVVESQAEVVPEALQKPDVSEEAAETNTPESSEAEDVLDEQEPAEEPSEEPAQRSPAEYPLCEPGEVEFSLFTSAGGMGISVETLFYCA